MADMSAYDFTVRSSLREYHVRFVEDLDRSLGGKIGEGDRVLVDEAVLELHGERLRALLERCPHLALTANEGQKSYDGVASIFEWLIQGDFRRGGRVIGIGGGVIQDVAAFVSSLLYRGVEWLFAPTTLLAQGDSCIGSKTSINFRGFKNQLGGFYPPTEIHIDTSFLTTLPERELRSGLGEMAHYFPIAGEEAFAGFERDLEAAFHDEVKLGNLIRQSLAIKRTYVEIDEFDRRERQVFNYGHSFGHALEAVTDYRIPHGIAVAYGMDLANMVSVRLGLLDETTRNRIRRMLSRIWDGIEVGPIDLDAYERAMWRDKKNAGGKLGLILTRGFGDVFKQFVPLDAKLSTWLREYFRGLSAQADGGA
jgi:3-dehydroquinate synthase